jgi:hypothetical protein
MSKLRIHNFAISLDGYGAGPSQDLTNLLGVGGPELHEWFVQTTLCCRPRESGVHTPFPIESTRRMGPRFRGGRQRKGSFAIAGQRRGDVRDSCNTGR